jgi:tetraacyldisaccharide 4'-kinase
LIKPKRLEAKIISVGNITLGGTGKTPLVIYIGQRLKSKPENFAILTRGYKRETEEMVELKDKKFAWKDVGDEPYMLSLRLPHVPIFIYKNRFEAGKEALSKYNTKIFVLDDGFQHWELQRDVNIVVIDCLNPFGGGKLFPAGFLREPLTALRRADIFVLNRVDQAANVDEIKRVLNRYNPDALKVETLYLLDSVKDFSDNSLVDVETLKGKKVVAFSGIANPFSFERTLAGSGIVMVRHFKFSDHFPYAEKDILKLEKDSSNLGAEAILTTEKDAVRIPKIDHLKMPLYILGIKLKIVKGEENFWRAMGIS